MMSLCASQIQNHIKKCSSECWKMRGSHELSVSARLAAIFRVSSEIGFDFQIIVTLD